MKIVILKFGGTSVGTINRIKRVAKIIINYKKKNYKVIVVSSAMSGATNRLVKKSKEISPKFIASEYDVLVSSGEQVTSGLLALHLNKIGINARSWMAWQIPFVTDSTYTKARITEIRAAELKASLDEKCVAVVPGFQGVTNNKRITTLGRGGSDTTAVALAAALNAERCDIYTDVDGVYTTDPRIVAKARKIDAVTYEEMLEMASQGAKVLQTRSVALAMLYDVRLQVLSSFENKPGTLVLNEEEILEHETVTGIAYSPDEAKITLRRVGDKPGVAANIFGSLAKASINVDMIVQNVSEDGNATDITFTVSQTDSERTSEVLHNLRNEIGFSDLIADRNVTKISVIGVGMRSQPGVATTMFKTLGEKGINIEVISTSEIKVSVLIRSEYTELAVRALHTAYGLDSS